MWFPISRFVRRIFRNLQQLIHRSAVNEVLQLHDLTYAHAYVCMSISPDRKLVAFAVSGQRAAGLWRCFSINLCPLQARHTPIGFALLLLLLLWAPKPLRNSPQLFYLFLLAGTLVLNHFGIISCCFCRYWTCAWHLTSVNDAVSAHLRFSNALTCDYAYENHAVTVIIYNRYVRLNIPYFHLYTYFKSMLAIVKRLIFFQNVY